MSATLTPKRKSARDRPASSKERMGDGGRESGRSTEVLVVRTSDSPRAVGSWRTLPGGQYRTLMPRGLSPVVLRHAVVCEIGRPSFT